MVRTGERKLAKKAFRVAIDLFEDLNMIDQQNDSIDTARDIIRKNLENIFGYAKLEKESLILTSLSADDFTPTNNIFSVALSSEEVSKFLSLMQTLKYEVQGKKYIQVSLNSEYTETEYIADMQKSESKIFLSYSRSDIKNSFHKHKVSMFTYQAMGNFGEQSIHSFDSEYACKAFSLSFDSWTGFSQLMRDIAINYHLVCGSFENIIICEQCKKMSFCDNANKKFCSIGCKTKFNRNDDLVMKQCYSRQRTFLDNVKLKLQLENLIHVKLDDCRVCLLQEKPISGECPVILDRNREAIIQFNRVKHLKK